MDDVLREYLSGIFGQRGVEVYEEVFFGDGPLSLSRRVDQTFSRLRGMSTGAATNRDLTSNTSRLDQWLSKLGYLANYRSFGQNFPVQFSGQREEISFEGSGRLYDMYPGEENELGGWCRYTEQNTSSMTSGERRNRSLTSQSVTTRSVIDGSGASILMRLSVHIATPTSRPHKSTASRQLSAR